MSSTDVAACLPHLLELQMSWILAVEVLVLGNCLQEQAATKKRQRLVRDTAALTRCSVANMKAMQGRVAPQILQFSAQPFIL